MAGISSEGRRCSPGLNARDFEKKLEDRKEIKIQKNNEKLQ